MNTDSDVTCGLIIVLLIVGLLLGLFIGQEWNCVDMAKQFQAKNHRSIPECDLQFEDGVWITLDKYLEQLIQKGNSDE